MPHWPRPTPSPRPLVVELCGLPGSGKSTLAARLAEAVPAGVTLVDARVSAAAPLPVRLARKLALLGRGAASSPWHLLSTAGTLVRGQPGRDRLAVPVQWFLAQRLLVEARRAPGGVALVEEGLVQALWTAGSLRRGGADVGRLLDLAATAVRPDLVVHLDLPPRTVLARLRGRDSRHSRVQHLPPGRQLDALRAGADLLASLLGEWQRRGYGDVLVVPGDAEDPLDVVATAVLSRAEALVR